MSTKILSQLSRKSRHRSCWPSCGQSRQQVRPIWRIRWCSMQVPSFVLRWPPRVRLPTLPPRCVVHWHRINMKTSPPLQTPMSLPSCWWLPLTAMARATSTTVMEHDEIRHERPLSGVELANLKAACRVHQLWVLKSQRPPEAVVRHGGCQVWRKL